MQIHRTLENFSAKNPVLTIGMFDGVHKGHKALLTKINEAKKDLNGESVLLTFWPHPQIFLGKQDGFNMLSTIEEKSDLLEKTGLDHLIILPFSKEFAALSAEEYIHEILHKGIGVKKVFIGYDHRFGKKGTGDFCLMKKEGQKLGFETEEIQAVSVDSINVSSTKVRKAIKLGDFEKAYSYLEYNYSMKGAVIHGKKIGRTIGVPTANLKPESEFKLIPAKGVYVAFVEYNGQKYKSAVSVGLNQTVNEANNQTSIEAYILDFDKNIYDEEIRIFFLSKIRNEKKFSSLGELKSAINIDIECVRSY